MMGSRLAHCYKESAISNCRQNRSVIAESVRQDLDHGVAL